ncbi:MAG: arginyltransferase [Alphaproteobacteria bacterium]|nr:arginyltransferase [Alphaproteobacteria bacterium]
MKVEPVLDTRFFFATAPLPCPYLDGRMERRIVTELVGRDAMSLHDALTHAGFRRSHAIVYAPACTGCDSCIPLRIVAGDFRPSRTQRRLWARNTARFEVIERPPVATAEQFNLFVRYQESRHAEGDMARMDFEDFRALIEDTPVDTAMVELRDENGALVSVVLTDRIADGLSAVYSFFEPNRPKDSFGTFMILWLVARARALALSYVYLGFWISDCRKMNYKSKFSPAEVRGRNGWVPLAAGPA